MVNTKKNTSYVLSKLCCSTCKAVATNCSYFIPCSCFESQAVTNSLQLLCNSKLMTETSKELKLFMPRSCLCKHQVSIREVQPNLPFISHSPCSKNGDLHLSHDSQTDDEEVIASIFFSSISIIIMHERKYNPCLRNPVYREHAFGVRIQNSHPHALTQKKVLTYCGNSLV